ncbi:hypothetical protein [Frigoriglobus tundricola]|uniref:Uncharacterized protein n=1 Tax=Frigoriglobus tundricola TaxID=2774151 RepID=A0A6M5YKV5_9BACT|nr:hypothetical protein [Frigoriglobus tundricola]QJW93901.1 hypothetical protein FTUN_1415 [Frigoriglobus tundricola]
MYTLALALLATAPAQPPAKHEDQNPLYKNLLESGLDVGGGVKVKFPAPSMPDGLDGTKQTAIIKELIGAQYSYDEFVRNSNVAPQLLKIRDIAPSDPKAPARGVDVWFVAYGDFKRLEDEKFLDRVTSTNRGGGKGGPLTNPDLAKRKIELPKGNQKREGYGHVEFDFLEKVRLNAAGHAMWSRTSESVVAAAEIDPRFLDDKEFPNQWRSITKTGGQTKVGDPNPWSGAGMYFKITKLAAPEGALFVEQHVVFAEPTGWFDGANLLRSKLSIAVQDNVRTMRREFQKK